MNIEGARFSLVPLWEPWVLRLFVAQRVPMRIDMRTGMKITSTTTTITDIDTGASRAAD
ncbi:hypothetical protein PC116_g34423 [Phytophthora cactorum]|nr:hypothetical protein PC116_g34423 [Phytophthora cactorum]